MCSGRLRDANAYWSSASRSSCWDAKTSLSSSEPQIGQLRAVSSPRNPPPVTGDRLRAVTITGVTGSEVTAVRPAPVEIARPQAERLTARASAVLHLLAAASLLILLIALALVAFGPSESLETRQWVLAFAVALPSSIFVASNQAEGLDEARAAWAVAAAMIALGLALGLRRTGSGDTLHHAIVALAAAGALAAPWLVRRVTPPAGAEAGWATATIALVVIALLFVPDAALRSGRLVSALVLAGVALVALLATADRRQRPRVRLAVDLALAGILGLVVLSVPDIRATGYSLVHHHDFYLGPVNAVMHGRPMLDGTWSQYGVGVMDALRAMFAVVPFGYGGLALIVGLLTAAQYVLVYATLRMATGSQLLVAAILAAEVVAHILGLDVSYLAVPSTSPLRFGLPYVVVALAVLAARYPARARAARIGEVVVLAISAVWSFESFVYTAATFGLIVIVTELAAGPGSLRRVLRAGAIAAGACVAAVGIYTVLVILLSGGAHWGPYLDYLHLYSVDGFGQLPIVFFSPGPVMGAVIFLTVVGTVHLARTRSPAATAPQLAALAGFGGMALGTFTYYLGRSHPTNLLNILLPTVVLGGLWAALLLQARPSPARIAGLGAILTAAAMLAAMGWPIAKLRWQDSAFAQGVPYADGKPAGQGRSLGFALKRMWHEPVFDGRAQSGAALLDRNLPRGAPALVLTEPDLSTGVRSCARAAQPAADQQPDRGRPARLERRPRPRGRRARAAGTLMLTTPPPKVPGQTGALGGNPLDFVGVQVVRTRRPTPPVPFHRVEVTPDGLQLVRLQPHEPATVKKAP